MEESSSTRNKKRQKRKERNEENTKPEEAPKEKQTDENTDKFILKKYMDTDIDTLNQTEEKKMRPFIEEIRETIKIFKTDNFDALAKITEKQVKK